MSVSKRSTVVTSRILHLGIGLVSLVIFGMTACSRTSSERVSVTEEIDSEEASPVQPQDDRDRSIREYLHEMGVDLSEYVARSGNYFAISVTSRTDSSEQLFILMAAGNSVKLMTDPYVQPPWSGIAPEVEWVSLNGGEVDHLRFTLTDCVEGTPATELFRIDNDSLRSAYKDAHETTMASVVSDLDGDQRPELLVYLPHPSDPEPGDCILCQGGARMQFGMYMTWVQVHRWSGNGWVAAESAYPGFYRGLADTYDRMHQWVTRSTGQLRMDCEYEHWLREGQTLLDWAERARRLADGGQ